MDLFQLWSLYIFSNEKDKETDVINVSDDQLAMLMPEDIDIVAKTLVTPKGIRRLLDVSYNMNKQNKQIFF